MALAGNQTFTRSLNEIVVSDYPVLTEPETVAAGADAAQWAVVGKVTATDKVILSLAGAVDGSENPIGILATPAAAAAADVVAPVYKSGQFDPSKLVYGAGHDEASVKLAFEGTPLFLRQPLV